MASQKFLDTNVGKIAVGVLLVGALGVAIWALKGSIGNSAAASANERLFVDAKTGKSFTADLKAGMKFPISAPSGDTSGYPAELCWWTKDGKVRAEPYGVLMNSWINKPEPTFCPDCGRLVVAHNPAPDPSDPKPPPLQKEYKGSSTTDRER